MSPVTRMDNTSIPTIPEFFANKCVLITGCTGFLGKVLLEKLLRSCPDIETIYLLLKCKHKKDPHTRVKDLISLPVYNLCRSQVPGFENKIFVMKGDVSELWLGLSEKDYTTLIEKVNIVFHVAATVHFNEALSNAIKTNTRGTREIVELCLKMKFLQALVHVSTAYSNCDNYEIKETVYPSHVDWKDAIEVCEKVDPAILNTLQDKYIGRLPNTYVLTKNMAEHVILDHAHLLPVAIFRPSIVSSWEEPLPGWIDNFNGPVALFIAYGSALMKTFMGRAEAIPDHVPVDIASRFAIIAAWKTAVFGSQDPNDFVYNCTCEAIYDFQWTLTEVMNLGRKVQEEFPLTNMVWIVKEPRLVTSETYFRIFTLFESLPAAVLIDTALKIKGQKPILVKIVRKLFLGMMMLSYFTTRTWNFKNKNFCSLNKIVLPEDKENFYTDFSALDFETNYKCAIIGGRKYLLNDDEKNIPKTKNRLKRLYWVDKALQVAGAGFLLWMINIPARIQHFINTVATF